MIEGLVRIIIGVIIGIHPDIDVILSYIGKIKPSRLFLLNNVWRSRA